MKLHYLFLALSVCCFTISCGNSSKNQQTEVTTQQVNPLEEAFKEIKILKDSCDKSILNKNWSVLDNQVRDFVQTEIIKNKIIQDKSNRYFDKLVALATDKLNHPIEVKYENNTYKYVILTIDGITPVSTAELIYIPESNQFSINFTENGRNVQSDGKVHYNTEGWEIQYPKDEFNEDIKSEPFLFYSLMGNSEVEALKLCITIVPKVNGMSFYTNEFYSSGYDIKQILVKDNNSGKVYSLNYDKLINNDAGIWFRDIGVVMYGTNFNDFVNLISSLSDYTISICNENNENVVIKNPENLCNIRDAVEKYLINNEY